MRYQNKRVEEEDEGRGGRPLSQQNERALSLSLLSERREMVDCRFLFIFSTGQKYFFDNRRSFSFFSHFCCAAIFSAPAATEFAHVVAQPRHAAEVRYTSL
jgi:hypothetical protein